jgi:methionine-rich copper-binding protein CopC
MCNSSIIANAAAFLLVGTVVATAHAYLDHAEPRVGNTVRPAPRELTLWFTQNLEAAFSTVASPMNPGSESTPATSRPEIG